jgi:predicted flavoprotein YhiN
MTKELTIIGAGPAGTTAALFAARNGTQVTLIEGNATVGRKLLVTGAGRCNLSNDNVSAERYTCGDAQWMEEVLAHFGIADLLAFLPTIGIFTYATHDGWCYPLSESAQTVVDAFYYALVQAGVNLLWIIKLQLYATQRRIRNQFQNTAPADLRAAADRRGRRRLPHSGSRGTLFPT